MTMATAVPPGTCGHECLTKRARRGTLQLDKWVQRKDLLLRGNLWPQGATTRVVISMDEQRIQQRWESATPMMQQYLEAKRACPDALLLFRMGDFYELFYEDAQRASQALGLTLTSREKGDNAIPMAGFPHHQLESYLGKLISLGFRVAVCEQVEDPRKATGLVRREVTRLVTPGTLTDDGLLDPREPNYLAAWVEAARSDADGRLSGLAWCDLSTGRFWAMVLSPDTLPDHLARIAPRELLLVEDGPIPPGVDPQIAVTRRPPWAFSFESAVTALSTQFGTSTLEGFGFTDRDRPAIRAAGAVLDYLKETQRTSLVHIDRLLPYRSSTALELDLATRRSLELTRTLHEGRREGSLLWVLDQTVTAMGSRLLADWLASPLADRAAIEQRLDAVAQCVACPTQRAEVRRLLTQLPDLERLVARVTTGRTTPRDLQAVGKALALLPPLIEQLRPFDARLFQAITQRMDPLEALRDELQAALQDACPVQARDGGFIRPGYHAELDRLRSLAHGGKQWIAKYQAQEIQRTGIANLKVGYNKIFGFYIEVTNAHRDKIPADYIRKQTLKNAERYITPELKEYEEQVLTADERAKELEFEIFEQLRETATCKAKELLQNARALAEADVLLALGELAHRRRYCRPKIVAEPVLEILDGRHPVLDVTEPEGTFVPNDTHMGADNGTMLLITGPNMAGKSTYIRQVALLTLMAQMGSFIPARQATIGIADRIFARVGASDQLARGQSTFMVEMTETARILHLATPHSLVILDEIGRGTSTYDGVSLAWAIAEYLHDRIGCRTLFATHYHELTDLAYSLSGLRNLTVAVREWQDQVVFLHKIVPGTADKSYGIHVARLAGVPREVNERAKEVLNFLENEHLDEQGRPKATARRTSRSSGYVQLTFFSPMPHPVLDAIRQIQIEQLTPLEALRLIAEWQEQVKQSNCQPVVEKPKLTGNRQPRNENDAKHADVP